MKPSAARNGGDEQEDPVLAYLAQMPVDDEPVTAEEERAIAEGWAAYRCGEVVVAAEAKRQAIEQPQGEKGAPA